MIVFALVVSITNHHHIVINLFRLIDLMKHVNFFLIAAINLIRVQSLIGPRNLARFEIKTIYNNQQCHQVIGILEYAYIYFKKG